MTLATGDQAQIPYIWRMYWERIPDNFPEKATTNTHHVELGSHRGVLIRGVGNLT